MAREVLNDEKRPRPGPKARTGALSYGASVDGVGELVEGIPPACPSGHRWGPPVNGTTLVVIGWRPCGCAGTEGNGGHHTAHCEKPGCPTPWWLSGGHDPDALEVVPYGRG